MKLKMSDKSEATTQVSPKGGAVIADRFKLDVDDAAGKGPAGVGKTAALCALIGSVACIALLGVVAWMLYQNWELVKDF